MVISLEPGVTSLSEKETPKHEINYRIIQKRPALAVPGNGKKVYTSA